MIKVGLIPECGKVLPTMCGDILSIKNMLMSSKHIHVDIMSVHYKNYVDISSNNFQINNYDAIFIYLTSLMMFGGEEVQEQSYLYQKLHNYTGPIYYIHIDSKYNLLNYYEKIKNKSWAQNYSVTQFELPSTPNIISMFTDKTLIREKQELEINKIYTVPFGLMPLYRLQESTVPNSFFGKSTDLIYGGFIRSAERMKNITNYILSQKEINTEIYCMSPDKFTDIPLNCRTIFSPKANWEDVLNKNSEAYATFIPADKYYNGIITPRILESLLSDDCICFMMNEYDTEHKILKNDYFYVNSPEELAFKVKESRDNENLRQSLLLHQKSLLEEFKKIDVGKMFYNILTDNYKEI